MVTSGVDIRQSGPQIIIRASLKTSGGSVVNSGTAEVRLFELQDDGTLQVFDWNDNAFKATDPTTQFSTLTYRKGNPSGADDIETGIWTLPVTTLTDFVVGNIYFAIVTHTSASPVSQEREFQYAGAEGAVALSFSPINIVQAPSNTNAPPIPLEQFEEETKTYVLEALDSAQNPVDMSGDTLVFVVYRIDASSATIFTVSGGDIVVTGANSNVANITVSSSKTLNLEGEYSWILWHQPVSNADLIRSHGKFRIRPSRKS